MFCKIYVWVFHFGGCWNNVVFFISGLVAYCPYIGNWLLWFDAVSCILTKLPLFILGGFFGLGFCCCLFLCGFFSFSYFLDFFYINNHVICERREFYFFLPISSSWHSTSATIVSRCSKRVVGGGLASLPGTWTQWESFDFLTMKYFVSCRVVVFLFVYLKIFLINLRKFHSTLSLLSFDYE